jgi:hypothetical protein
MELAPVALFVYNRPETLSKTLESLKNNKLIKKTDIYIFSDGPTSNKRDKKKVYKVRKIIKDVKNLKIKKTIFYKTNRGLKKNIIEGINYVFKNHSKIIVLEDDLLVSPYFIKYMNRSLNFIKYKKKIWHVSAWNYPIKTNFKNLNDTFLWHNMNCWGWGTHKNDWNKLILDSNFFIKSFSNKQINFFNLDGNLNNWSQLTRNHQKKLYTWAIFWNATIFWNKGLCLNPVKSYVKNIGFDKNATNTLKYITQSENLNSNAKINFPKKQETNQFYIKKIKSHIFLCQKINLIGFFINKIFNIFK